MIVLMIAHQYLFYFCFLARVNKIFCNTYQLQQDVGIGKFCKTSNLLTECILYCRTNNLLSSFTEENLCCCHDDKEKSELMNEYVIVWKGRKFYSFLTLTVNLFLDKI